ncbi:MAG: O-antigen ligase family protein [Pyrinomonadaceae bacterium]|nr:O-antigen ligase family protein [Pyrinomonadaceae bacterium]
MSRRAGAIVFYALLVLIPLTAIPYGTVDPLWEALFECVVFALAIIYILEVAVDGKIDSGSVGLILPLLLFVAYALIQTLPLGSGNQSPAVTEMWYAISADPFQTRRWAVKVLALILAGAMLFRYTNTERHLRLLVYTILLTGTASALFGIFRQSTQRAKGFLFLSGLQPEFGYAQFINKNHFAFLAEMALGLTLGALISREVRRERKLIYLTVSLPLWAALILSGSRGGIFSLLGQILFLVMMWTMAGRTARLGISHRLQLDRLKGAWPVRLLLLCGLLAFILIGTIWMGGDPLVSRLESVQGEINQTESSEQGTSRREIWRSTWMLIKEHPVTGVGFGGYWTAIPQYHMASGEATPQEAHNDYLELLASGGFIALLPATWFLVAFLRRVRKVWKTSVGYPRAAQLGALTGIFGVALHSMVDFGLHITSNALTFTALLVIASTDILTKNYTLRDDEKD